MASDKHTKVPAPAMQAPELRDVVRHAVAEEIRPLTDRVQVLEGGFEDLKAGQVMLNEKLTTCYDALQKCSANALSAATAALDAQKKATDTIDECTKIVKSAMAIHSTSIVATVDECVAKAIAPVVKNDSAQNHALVVIAREFDITERLDPDLVKSVPDDANKKAGAVERIERRARGSTLIQALIALAVIVKALYDLFLTSHP